MQAAQTVLFRVMSPLVLVISWDLLKVRKHRISNIIISCIYIYIYFSPNATITPPDV